MKFATKKVEIGKKYFTVYMSDDYTYYYADTESLTVLATEKHGEDLYCQVLDESNLIFWILADQLYDDFNIAQYAAEIYNKWDNGEISDEEFEELE